MTFPRLFSEITVGGLTLPNRTMMAAMSSGLADERGRITSEQVAYYRERARGGVGMVTVEFACVAGEHGISERTQVVLDHDDAIPGHARLVRAIRSEGAAAALQLQMPGQFAYRRPGLLPVAPSDVRSRRDGTLRARGLDHSEIEQVVGYFAAAARRAVEAGYQAIELHGAHGYLLHAFLSPEMNRRDDDWGGDARRRLAFPCAVAAAVKRAIAERPLWYRFSAEDYTRDGLTVEDWARFAPRLVSAGVDVLDVSTGVLGKSLERTVDPMSVEGWRFALSRRIKQAVDVPVAAIGSRRPDYAERALERGDADIIALGRPLLADPDWAAKARAGRGHLIRPCTSCNWCFDRVSKHRPTACAENPRTGRETVPLLPTSAVRAGRIAVIGGGPGGMAAAIQARSVGFDVTLFERETSLGGGLIASAAPPNKDNLLWYRDYLVDRLLESGAEVRKGEHATLEKILELQPFAVIQAQGAEQVAYDLPGAASISIVSAYDLLLGKGPAPTSWAGPAVVYGGGETGCETAELLTAHGIEVTLVTRSGDHELARAAEALYRKVMLGRVRANPLLTIVSHTHITDVTDGAVELAGPQGSRRLPVRMVVLAQGRESNVDMHAELEAAGVRTILVGDTRDIARIGEAVHQANDAIRELAGSDAEAPPP